MYVEAFTSFGDENVFKSLDEAIKWLCEVTHPKGEGWVVEHYHTPDVVDCSCVQYLHSHKPIVVNGKEV